MRILLVEDNPRLVEVLKRALRDDGHVVESAAGLEGARTAATAKHFDIAIVDVALADGSGLDFCREVRAEGQTLPILLLTARNEVEDRVAGLDSGADDYLAKPFSIVELKARLRALLRRGPRWTDSSRSYGALVVARDRRLVTWKETRIPLTPREFEIVALLAWRDGRAVSRDEILEAVWGDATGGGGASLDVLVTRIRRKAESAGAGEVIRTVRQVGYAWALERSKND